MRQQIQAVYDAGYDEWLLWSAACRYHWGGLESSKEAKKQKSSQSPAADSLENQAGDKAA